MYQNVGLMYQNVGLLKQIRLGQKQLKCKVNKFQKHFVVNYSNLSLLLCFDRDNRLPKLTVLAHLILLKVSTSQNCSVTTVS